MIELRWLKTVNPESIDTVVLQYRTVNSMISATSTGISTSGVMIPGYGEWKDVPIVEQNAN